ncbi:uncharacterized protein L203_100597 [Cryptococcus depauperatus CBS 7841]|uniref:Uncharacterized protein n=1 Tax=Cryptococcus depauperatus CBS 7841 TaxID=1295531 RepID=A0A1E3IWX0_9TREE|nr:hypothetical protein L203_00383 [Cryptococcus depauperatus CBS 7841]
MRMLLAFYWVNYLLGLHVEAVTSVSSGRPGHGLIGYGIDMYKPLCAVACKDVAPMTLICNDSADAHHMGMKKRMSMGHHSPSASCLSTHIPYLQTVAYCMSIHCSDSTALARREDWWTKSLVGSAVNQPGPIISYQAALMSITTFPNATLPPNAILTSPALVDEGKYRADFATLNVFQWVEAQHSRYCIVIVTAGFLVPIFLSLLRRIPVPFMSHLCSRLIDAPLFSRPLQLAYYGRFPNPSRGQFGFVLYLLLLNIILASVGYRSASPNTWYDNRTQELSAYIANRVGSLSFANIPLLILYAGRNNLLLWLTDWSHSTFLIAHRCVAAICTIEACLHSAMYLQSYLAKGEHSSEAKLGYWIMGIVATLALSLSLAFSLRPVRAASYQVFLALHISFAILTIVGCWYHILWRYQRQWGYENWIITAMAVWGFDWFMRFARVLKNGVKRATVYRLDDDYLRIDVMGMEASGHVYVYFPTLTWRIWENHPFSVAAVDCHPTDSLPPFKPTLPQEKSFTLFVRKLSGTTALLARSPTFYSLPVLVESYAPYTPHTPYAPPTSNTLFIAGGVGITALLPQLSRSAKLYWSVRSAALIDAVHDILSAQGKSAQVEMHISPRVDLAQVFQKERFNTVIVCGPPSMMEEARRLASAAAIEYIEERFHW